MHKPTISTHAYVDTMVDTVYTARRGGFQTLGAAGHLAAPFCHGYSCRVGTWVEMGMQQ